MRPYKNLWKRVQNHGTGQLGTVIEATREPDSKVWALTIKFDTDPEGREMEWDSASCWRFNRIVADDYAPDYGPIRKRIEAIMERLSSDIPMQFRHITEVPVGYDCITAWKPGFQYEVTASLWAGQGSWRSKHSDKDKAIMDLCRQLGDYLAKVEDPK
jgi:hypothetical protein